MPKRSNRVKIHVRVHPETERIGRQLAKKYFSDEKKLGYVIDEAINLFHASKTRPEEVESLLSSTEEYIIRNFNQQVKRATERVTDMVARSVYEINLISLMVDRIGFRALPDWKEQLALLRKEAHQKTKRKVGDEYSPEIAGLIEENERLEKEVKELQRKLSQVVQNIQQQEKENGRREADRRRLEEQHEEIKRLRRERDQIAAWTRGLMYHLIEHYSRVKSNEKLVEEYIQTNPKPEGL